MKTHCLSLKAEYDALFQNKSKITAFVLKPLKSMPKPIVDIFFLQQLEYEIESTDIPDYYNFFKSDIVVIVPSLTHIFNLINPLN